MTPDEIIAAQQAQIRMLERKLIAEMAAFSYSLVAATGWNSDLKKRVDSLVDEQVRLFEDRWQGIAEGEAVS